MKRATLLLLCLASSGCVMVVHRTTTVAGTQRTTLAAAPGAEVQFRTAVASESAAADAKSERERRQALEQARDSYDRAIAQTPRDPSMLARRANVRAELGDRAGAERDIEIAVARSTGADRAFFLRRAGDLAAGHDSTLSGLRYLQALELNPYDIATHERVAAHLANPPNAEVAGAQIPNYLRFLLEYKRTDRMAAAAVTLVDDAAPQELAAATSAALAQAADVVPPEQLVETAAAFLERSPAGPELRAVLDGRSTPWTWLAANGAATIATSAPPHAAYRALTHAEATGFVQRGDLPRAERQHRLSLEMPGANMDDLLELLEFLASYGSEADVCATVQLEEAKLAQRTKLEQIAFRTGAMNAFALRGKCGGSDTCNVAAQVRATYEIGGAPSDLARDLCPDAAAALPSCPMSIAMSDSMAGALSNQPYRGTLFIASIDDPDCALEEALDTLRADYRADVMPPLIIETSDSAMPRAERVKRWLDERGIDATIVRGGMEERRFLIRFDREERRRPAG